MTLFIDLDGVLADMNTAYAAIAGAPPDKTLDNVDWQAVVAVPGFYANMPPLPDMAELWSYVSTWPDVMILTGVPKSVPEAEADKRAWVTKHLGAHVKMIGCASRDKCRYAKPGDILVDDWERYREHWLEAGGTWITHLNAASSIAALKELALL
jgi:hypothetical protein